MNKRFDTQKLSLHPHNVADWLDKGYTCPLYLELTPTNSCNHECIFCAVDFCRGTDFLNADVMAKFLQDSYDLGTRSIMIAGEGEPYMHKEFERMIIPTANKLDFAISTNGVLATPQRLAMILPFLTGIRFSIDSGTPENYQEIHKCKHKNDFWQAFTNIVKATEIKKQIQSKCDISVQFIALKENIDTLGQFLDIYIKTDVDLIAIKPYTPATLCEHNLDESYDASFHKQLNEIISKFNDKRIKVRADSFERAETELSHRVCHALSFWGHVVANGNVYACGNFLHSQDFYLGNMYQESAEEIWLGEKRQKIIELGKQGFSDCRQNCRLESANAYLLELKEQIQDKWYNFI